MVSETGRRKSHLVAERGPAAVIERSVELSNAGSYQSYGEGNADAVTIGARLISSAQKPGPFAKNSATKKAADEQRLF